MANAGKYKHRVTFERDVGVADASGQQVEQWQPVAELWSEVKPLSGRQLIAAQQLVSEVTHRITTRFTPNFSLSPRLRATLGTRHLHIHHVINIDENDREMEMLCTEIT